MRLYSKTGATQIDDPVHGTITPGANGGFDMPEDLYRNLHGRPQWENDAEREQRIVTEQLDLARDPATLLAEVRTLGSNQGALISALVKALGVNPETLTDSVAPTEVETPDADEEAAAAPAKPSRSRGKGASSTPAE